jgi:hypothetical protein
MRPYLLRILVAAVLFSLPSITDSIPKNIPPRQTVWFVASQSSKGQLYLNPLARNEGGHLVPVPDSCDPDDSGYKKFVAENFGSGQAYNISFRGRFVGSAVFSESKEERKSYLVADAGMRKLIPADVSGLASIGAVSHSSIGRRLTPTPSEQAAVKEIAVRSFKEAGVSTALLTKIAVDKLERAYLLPSKRPSLIGSYSIDVSEEEGSVHSLFLIATKRGSEYQVDLLWSKVSRGETDNEKMELMDYANMFGDGQDEIVVELGLYENYFYRIYERKRNSSQWEQIFEAQASICE